MKKIKRADIERILIVCAAALVVVLALKGSEQTTSQVLVEQTLIPVEETMADPNVEKVSTVVFYEDGDGYLVPVTRKVEKTDGIAKATLNLMVKDSQNDMEAARLGLRTVIPEGTSFEIDIKDGRANVNVSKEALSCADAAQEALMVDAITNAMTCFATVEEVTLEFDGMKRSKLTYGTDVSGVFTGGNLNLESVETFSSAGADSVKLYFPSSSGRMLVPVTRTVYSDADVNTAMLELCKGPKKDSGLMAPLPQGCGVRGVTMKNGIVTVDFSKEFLEAVSGDEGLQAVRAVLFTARQFPGVKQVNITVEGNPYTLPEATVSTFINQAQEVMTYYPGVIEID